MCNVLSMPMSTAVGDFVNEDEVLAEIETDKVSYCSIYTRLYIVQEKLFIGNAIMNS